MIKVLKKNSTHFEEMPLSELEAAFAFRWLKSLEFQTPEIHAKVLKRAALAVRKKQLSEKEKYLGVNFHKEISMGSYPEVSIRWVNESVGYGVFAEKEIVAGRFIGEYTGRVRKRLGRFDRKNDYCFEYCIGQWRLNPFIIDAKGQGNITRFINHSNRPNIEPVSVYANEVMHIILISTARIDKGAQLLYDYGATYWRKRRHLLLDNL